MKSRTKFTLASSIIVILLVGISIFLLKAKESYTEKTKEVPAELKAECSDGDTKECVSAEGYIGYRSCVNGEYSLQCFIANLDECTIGRDQLSNVCCKIRDGSLVDCNQKTTFSQGEYVIIKVNLQKAVQESGLGYNEYKACAFSKMLSGETEIPERYYRKAEFSSDEVGCSRTFLAENFHQYTIAGIVPPAEKAVLAEVRIYPSDAQLNSGNDALQSIDLSTRVYLLEADVNA